MTTNTNKTAEKISQSVNSFLDDQKLCLTDIKKEEIIQITKILLDKRNDEKQFFVCGNGGSASTASHFVSDLLKTSITKNNFWGVKSPLRQACIFLDKMTIFWSFFRANHGAVVRCV